MIRAVLLVLLVLVAVVVLWWVTVSYGTFPHATLPGGVYTVAGHEARVPALPHAQYKSGDLPSMMCPVPRLDQDLLDGVYRLANAVLAGLREAEITTWMTGGSLISAWMWHAPMCYDDDVDMAVRWEDRRRLWSGEMEQVWERHGLEAFYLRGCSLDWATKEGGCVRVRFKGTVTPTADVFFVDWRPAGSAEATPDEGRWVHVNSWSDGGRVVHYDTTTEVYHPDWLFPLQEAKVLDAVWPVPNQPDRMLAKQYGEAWSRAVWSPNPLFRSHRWAMHVTNIMCVWKTKASG